MKLPVALLAVALAAIASPAHAEDAKDDDRRIAVGADVLFTYPLDALHDSTGPLFGLSLRGGAYVLPRVELYARGGYQMGLAVDRGVVNGASTSRRLNDLFVLAGGRWFVLQPFAGLYASLELGLHVLTPAETIGGATAYGDANTRFGGTVGVGYVLSPKLPIHVGAQLAVLNLIGRDSGDASTGTPAERTLLGVNALAGYELRF